MTRHFHSQLATNWRSFCHNVSSPVGNDYLSCKRNKIQSSPPRDAAWMVMVSAPILLIASLFFGDLVRDFRIIRLWGLLFQTIVFVAGGFPFWLWLASIYPALGVASFSFLRTIFQLFLGWALLNKTMNFTFIIAAILLRFSLVCINKKVKMGSNYSKKAQHNFQMFTHILSRAPYT